MKGPSKQLLAERDKRFLQYAKDDLNSVEAGRLEGMQSGYARTKLAKARDQLGLPKAKPGPPKRKPLKTNLADPYDRIRYRLANEMRKLEHSSKSHQIELARLIGVPRKLQIRAMEDPYDYEWSLANIVKLAKALKVDVNKFIMMLVIEREEDGTLRVGPEILGNHKPIQPAS